MSVNDIFYICLTVWVCIIFLWPFLRKHRKQRRTEITITETVGDQSVSKTTVTTEDL